VAGPGPVPPRLLLSSEERWKPKLLGPRGPEQVIRTSRAAIGACVGPQSLPARDLAGSTRRLPQALGSHSPSLGRETDGFPEAPGPGAQAGAGAVVAGRGSQSAAAKRHNQKVPAGKHTSFTPLRKASNAVR
jgi:hypothetical protein